MSSSVQVLEKKEHSSSMIGRAGHAVIEGLATPFTSSGLKRVFIINSLFSISQQGLTKVSQNCFSSLLLTALGRTISVFVSTKKYASSNEKSPFDFKVPKNFQGSSDLWNQLGHLTEAITKLNEEIPGFNIDDISMDEWTLRLLAILRQAKENQGKIPREVPGEDVPHGHWILAQKYIKFAEIIYFRETEDDLNQWLKEQGFELIYAKFKAGSLMPVHAVSISQQKKEVIIIVRGTYSWDDVVTDMVGNMMDVAKPDGKGFYKTHEGMARAAQELTERLYPMLASLHEAGFQITITGHSLGAGVSALMAYFLKDLKGLSSVNAFAFACPACVDFELGESLDKYVVSIVNRDDIVPRIHRDALSSLVQDMLAAPYEELEESAKVFPSFLGKRMLKNSKLREGSIINENDIKAVPGYLPGQVWYEHYVADGNEAVKIIVSKVSRSLKDLRVLKLTPVALTHHFLQHFQARQLGKEVQEELVRKSKEVQKRQENEDSYMEDIEYENN